MLKIEIYALIALALCASLSGAARLATMPSDVAVAGGVVLAIVDH